MDKKLGIVTHISHSSVKHKIGRAWSKLAWAKSETLFLKKPEQKRLEA
jgi:hypothetical protein